MQATAEKPTCTYIIKNGYTHTQCGEVEFADFTKDYKYCPDCGKKVEREEEMKGSRQVKLDNSKADDPIKPDHYRKGEIDLYESWYRTYPFNEFRAGMQMIAERYMKRDKNDRVEDLEKARYTLERLKEYEEMEKADTNQALDDLKNNNINTFDSV